MSRPGQDLPQNSAAIFKTVDAFFDAVLGPVTPAQVDATKRSRAEYLEHCKAGTERFKEALEADALARREAISQDIAERYNFKPESIRAARDRWATGGYSHLPVAITQRKLHNRALDIALERSAPAQAAE